MDDDFIETINRVRTDETRSRVEYIKADLEKRAQAYDNMATNGKGYGYYTLMANDCRSCIRLVERMFGEKSKSKKQA